MRNRGGFYVGALLLIFGAFFLLVQTSPLLAPLGIELGWAVAWPLIILLVGVAFWLPILVWWEKHAQLAGLVVPATIISANGMILLYQNLTGDWASWEYLWLLEPMAVGLGLVLLYVLGNRSRGLLLAAAIVGSAGLLFISLLGPLVMILVGLLIIVGGARRRAGGTPLEL